MIHTLRDAFWFARHSWPYLGCDKGKEVHVSTEHLRHVETPRGFKRLPPIPATHGGRPAGQALVHESSAADGPHLWLSISQPADRNHPDNGKTVEAAIHMRLDDARKLAEQVLYLADHHYQVRQPLAAEAGPQPAPSHALKAFQDSLTPEERQAFFDNLASCRGADPSEIVAAERRGYDKAVTALRDGDRYERWWIGAVMDSRRHQPLPPDREAVRAAADYLWATLRERTPPAPPPWGLDHAMFGLLGIPVVETDEVPAGMWRLVDSDGTVLHEGFSPSTPSSPARFSRRSSRTSPTSGRATIKEPRP